MTLFMHVGDRLLHRIAERDVAPGRLVRAHLAGCQRCRDRILFLRSLDELVQRLGGPSADDGLLNRIRTRISAGETVLLPAETAVIPYRRTGKALAAAAAGLAVLGFWILSPDRGIQASTTAGVLSFSPSRLVPGATMEVTYRDAGMFAAESVLVLRGRVRGPQHQHFNTALRQRSLARLVKTGRGAFKGTFMVPDSIVYASFSVENVAGTNVDSRNRELWSLLTTTSKRRPTYDALTQAYHDLMDGSSERALEVLRHRADLYPEHPTAWSDLIAFEAFMLGKAHVDSTIPQHRARLLAFHETFKPRDASLEIAHGMSLYAAAVQDSTRPEFRELAVYWRHRARADTAGTSLRARTYRLFAAQDSANAYPRRALRAYERAWHRGDSIVDFAAQNGLNFARAAGDPADILAWSSRVASRNPRVFAGPSYMRLAEDSAYREIAIERLHALARWLVGPRDTLKDALRPLELSVAEQAREDSAAASVILAAIGKALMVAGRTQSALDTLELAARETWNADLFNQIGELRLTAGDTAGAAEIFALAAVDPQTERSVADSLRQLVRISTERWGELTQVAYAEMRRRVLKGAVSRSLPTAPRVNARDGRTVSLDDLTAGSVTVVAFWSRHCGWSRIQVPGFSKLERQLANRSIRLVAITAEEPSASLDGFIREANVDFPVFYDRAGEAGRVFATTRTPDYFILDTAGRIRFANTDLTRVLTEAAALIPDTSATSPASFGP